MSFISAGNQAVNAAVKARQALAASKADYAAFGKQDIQDRTKEDAAVMDAKAKGRKAGIASKMYSRKDEIQRDTDAYVKGKQKQAKMAGKLAGGAALLGTAGFMSKEKFEANPMIDKLNSYVSDNNESMRQTAEEISSLNTEIEGYNTTVSEQDGSTDTTDSTEPLTGSKPISSAQSLDQGGGAYKGGAIATQSELTKFAEQAGFSPDNARIMGAIAMGESGGRLGIDTVQSGLDPNKSNEFSIGATQINVQAHGDKLKKLGLTPDDLRDPVNNFRVAKMVYDEMGSFSPWSVYKSGDYTKYLNNN